MAGFINGAVYFDSQAFTTSSGDNNDVPMNGSLMYIVISNDNDAITGIVPDSNLGFLAFVVNIGPTNNLVIKNNSSGSAVGNRILTYSGSDVTVAPLQTALLGYDTTNQQWHVIKFA